MGVLKISAEEWETLKIKLSRKYNHLTDDDLLYTPGQEEDLLLKLAARLRRNKEYVLFTLSKELSSIQSNSL
ncbi:hypothetical protein HP439_06250 [Sphingobacterium shayense]|uniref:hypothetical protein n=1 Tax=Sphingobacterium shayense TaxID=626343 RepID=UPI001556ED26|nr:hypothetical protein [Sphingobacterium shayense]NQD70321.1 hypothetical protein [Sphingobacterium shayense]